MFPESKVFKDKVQTEKVHDLSSSTCSQNTSIGPYFVFRFPVKNRILPIHSKPCYWGHTKFRNFPITQTLRLIFKRRWLNSRKSRRRLSGSKLDHFLLSHGSRTIPQSWVPKRWIAACAGVYVKQVLCASAYTFAYTFATRCAYALMYVQFVHLALGNGGWGVQLVYEGNCCLVWGVIFDRRKGRPTTICSLE